MIILDTTNKSLEIVLSAAPSIELPFTTNYVDITTTAFIPIANNGVTNSTTPVTIVAAPGSSTQRQTKFISVYNPSTGQQTVTIQLKDISTARTIFKCALDVGDVLTYIDSDGFKVYTSSGSLKTASVSSGLSEDGHKVLRQLIHFLPDGPGDGFAASPYKEVLPSANVFPTSIIWWTSASKTTKILEKIISYNANKTIASIDWKVYDGTGTLTITATDTISYSGIFETSRTRTYT